MFGYIVRRIFATIPVMVVVAIFVFALLHLSPGDPAAIIAGDNATSADIARIRAKLGLDEPLLVQFGEWVWHLLHGDLGISIFTNLPVSKLIAQRVGPTVSLTISTLIVSIVAAIPMGVLAAWKAGTWVDRVVMVFAVVGFSVPIFVLAYDAGILSLTGDRVTHGRGGTDLYETWPGLGLRSHKNLHCRCRVMFRRQMGLGRSCRIW